MKNISFNAFFAVLQTTLVETLVLSPNELLFAEVLKILKTIATPTPTPFFFLLQNFLLFWIALGSAHGVRWDFWSGTSERKFGINLLAPPLVCE